MPEYILSEDLAVWFGKKKKKKGSSQPKGPWVNICKKKKGGGHPPCGRGDADKGAYPVCRGAGVAGKMSQKEKDSACRRKREKEKKDPQSGKGQKPTRIKIKNYKKKSKKESIDRLVNLVTEKFKVDSKEYDDLFRDEKYLLVAPLTHNASCKYGAGTKWCTTNRDSDDMFEEHIIGGVLVYLIIRDKELAKEMGNSKFGLYRGWGEGPGRLLVYDELNTEYLNGEQWLSNEFEKVDMGGDYYMLMRYYNDYYKKMDKPLQNKEKPSLKEQLKGYDVEPFAMHADIFEVMWDGYMDDNLLRTYLSLRMKHPKRQKMVDYFYKFISENGEQIRKKKPTTMKESIIKELNKLKNRPQISEGLQYHIDNNIPLSENVYRVGSEKYFEVIKEARELYKEGQYNNEEDVELLESDLGKFFIYEGERLPLDFPMVNEAEYKGKKVELNKPKSGGPKKWYVYVRNPKTGKIKKVSYGSPVMTAKWNDPAARKSFAARHQCAKKKDKTKAGYWACRAHKDFGKNVPGRFW